MRGGRGEWYLGMEGGGERKRKVKREVKALVVAPQNRSHSPRRAEGGTGKRCYRPLCANPKQNWMKQINFDEEAVRNAR